ncbi:MAG: leucine-rich repeat domain-containing protein, partial [Candidatus Omnitrophica bacterium]|nr:leucine-rich repeat domain-containing protein [Candidatus Omnitrophota bacterium]
MNQEAEYWNPIIFPSLSILGTASISNLIINNSISDQLWGNTRISFDNQKGLVFSTSENQGEAIERTRIDLNGNISVSNNLFVRGYGQAGGIILSNGTIGLPVSGSTLTREGQLGWDSVWQTPSIKLNSNVTGQVFLEDFIFVTNVTDISIPDGAAVYAVGIEGKFRCVYLATSTNPICRISTKGLATEHILPHGSGHVTVRGDVNHINTSSFISNDAVYLSVVPGVLTSVLPQFPEDQISMGTVDIVSETEGRIGVNIRAVDRKEENLVGTLYSYNSKLSDINGYHLLSNEFENVEGYTTYTTNGITNGQTIISYLSPISRVTALAGGVSATIRLYATVSKDGNNLGGLIARLSAYTTNMTLLASYTSEYLLLDQNEIKRDIQVSILSNQTFTVPIRFSLDLIAQHTSDFRTYSVFAEDGRPLRVEVPLPSGQFAFRSDLDNYVTIPAWQYTNSIKLDITDGVATNLTIIKPLIIKGIDHSNQDLFFPQSNGVQVIGDPDQDLFYGLGGSIGKPAWWMQTYRNENPSSLHSPEFLYISNARIKKDIMVISEGGRVSINKNSNILDYHSDYQGYQTGNLNDLNFSGVYTYSKQRKYNVYISSVGNPDRWSWRKSYNNGLTWIESGITNDCSITNMVIENGIYVNFNNITGHNLYDAWVRTGYSQLPSATVHIAPPAYEEIGFVTNYNNESGWEDLTYTMSSTVHSDDRRILTNLTSAIYLGRGIKMNSVFFNLAEYAVGLNLVLEYWNGSNWNQISPVTHNLNDGTSNFMTSGQISWDKALMPDWQTNGVSRYSGEDYYWIRIRSSTVPSISPKIKNITPQGKTRFGIMGRAFDDDYAFYVDGFGSSYQIKGYQIDTGTTFEANQLITAGAVNNLLDAFRNFNLYFSTNNNPISVPNKLLTISTVPTWQTTTVLNSGINFVASFISTNMIGSTSIPANTKYSTTYYAAKTTSQEANTLWELIEVGNGFTNILGQSAETPLVQTTPTIISTSISTKSNMTVSSTGYLGVRIYGIRYGNAVSMNLYGGGNYGSSLVLPTLGGAPLSITEAPIDDIAYGRKNQSWTQVLEPDGSGVGLSGIVKETDPKYINTLTNEQDLAALRTYHYGSQDIIESQTNWFQTDNDGTITNFIYQTGRENVVIPWMIDGKEIIKIGDHAFLLKPIETITAPKTIKYIGETAFLLCTNLVSISFPAVEIITNQAFSNCRNLTNIILPNAYYFDNNVFSQCTNLQYANLPNATIFKNYVFYNCLKLHTVILPKIEEISSGAFENCNNLTSIVFSSNAPVVSSITSIFENTSSNLICTVNNSFATGWDDTFQGKRVVRLPVYADTAIIDNIFIGNTIQDTKLNIFTDGTNIYQTDVINHTNKISTDSSVTNISQHLIISAGTIYERPDLVPSPESWFTFDGTNTITGYVGPTVNSDNIVIPYQINGKPITKIGSYSFAHNYISHDVTGIIYMPNIITDIDDEAFPGYPNKVYLPSSLKRIGSGAFDESALAIFGDVILPEGLTNIGNYAFEYCTYVKNLTIGKNVKYIGNFQFGGFGYHAPVNIYWYGDKPEVGEQIFTTCPPNSVTNIIMNPQAS